MQVSNQQPNINANTVREVLEAFRDEVCECVSSELEALIVYGDVVRDQSTEHPSTTVNVMVVLNRTDSKTLNKLAAPVTNAASKLPFAVMTLTRSDLRSSCDVFPVKFHEMQQHYRVLIGEDVLSELSISDVHLRLRCEQRLKNLMLRLRATYVHHNTNSKYLSGFLFDARSHMIRDMGACLMVREGMQPESAKDIASEFADEFGIATEVLADIEAMADAKETFDNARIQSIYDQFMRLVEQASAAIDSLEVGS